MTDWPAFVDAWLARAAGDRRLAAIGTGTDAAFTLRSGDDVVWIHVREGVPAHYALDDGFDRRVDFGMDAPADVWERLWSAVPPPRHQGLFALLSKVPEFHVEGSREALAQHAHVLARLLELGRPSADAAAAATTGGRTCRRSPAATSPSRWRPARRSCSPSSPAPAATCCSCTPPAPTGASTTTCWPTPSCRPAGA